MSYKQINAYRRHKYGFRFYIQYLVARDGCYLLIGGRGLIENCCQGLSSVEFHFHKRHFSIFDVPIFIVALKPYVTRIIVQCDALTFSIKVDNASFVSTFFLSHKITHCQNFFFSFLFHHLFSVSIFFSI